MDKTLQRPNDLAIGWFNYLEESPDKAAYLARIGDMQEQGWDVAGGCAEYVDLSDRDGNVYRFNFGEFRKKSDIEAQAAVSGAPVELKHPYEFLMLSGQASTESHPGVPGADGKYRHTLTIRQGESEVEYFLLTDDRRLYPVDAAASDGTKTALKAALDEDFDSSFEGESTGFGYE